jgi:hypothetical protein
VELGGDQRLLVELGLLERTRGIAVVRHAVLPVFVEEELVEVAAEFVMVGDVARGAGLVIELVEAGGNAIDSAAKGAMGGQRQALVAGAGGGEPDEVANVMGWFDDQTPIHVGLASARLGVLGDMVGRALVGQADSQWVAAAVAITVNLAVMVRHDQLTMTDHADEKLVE